MKTPVEYILKPYVMVSPLSRDECMRRLREKLDPPCTGFSSALAKSLNPVQGRVDDSGAYIDRGRNGPVHVIIVSAGDRAQLTLAPYMSIVPIIMFTGMFLGFAYYIITNITTVGLQLPYAAAVDIHYSFIGIGMCVFVLCAYILLSLRMDRQNMHFLQSTLQARRVRAGDSVPRTA